MTEQEKLDLFVEEAPLWLLLGQCGAKGEGRHYCCRHKGHRGHHLCACLKDEPWENTDPTRPPIPIVLVCPKVHPVTGHKCRRRMGHRGPCGMIPFREDRV